MHVVEQIESLPLDSMNQNNVLWLHAYRPALVRVPMGKTVSHGLRSLYGTGAHPAFQEVGEIHQGANFCLEN